MIKVAVVLQLVANALDMEAISASGVLKYVFLYRFPNPMLIEEVY